MFLQFSLQFSLQSVESSCRHFLCVSLFRIVASGFCMFSDSDSGGVYHFLHLNLFIFKLEYKGHLRKGAVGPVIVVINAGHFYSLLFVLCYRSWSWRVFSAPLLSSM